jgi:hypothetical protein
MSNETKFLIGAIVAGSVAYLVPLYYQNIWLGLFLLLLVAVVYLGSLVRFANLKLKTKSSKWIVSSFALVLMIFQVFAFAHYYGRKDFQKDLLLEIRKVIDTGVTQTDVHSDLIYVLGQHHKNKRDSVIETARDLIPEKLGDNGVYISDFDLDNKDSEKDDETNYFYTADEEEDELIVIVVTEVSLGENPEFENYDGQRGRFEMVYTLSEEGVDYEVRN